LCAWEGHARPGVCQESWVGGCQRGKGRSRHQTVARDRLTRFGETIRSLSTPPTPHPHPTAHATDPHRPSLPSRSRGGAASALENPELHLISHDCGWAYHAKLNSTRNGSSFFRGGNLGFWRTDFLSWIQARMKLRLESLKSLDRLSLGCEEQGIKPGNTFRQIISGFRLNSMRRASDDCGRGGWEVREEVLKTAVRNRRGDPRSCHRR